MRSLISTVLVTLLIFSSAAFGQGRRGPAQGQGQGIQQQKRIHTPGSGLGTQDRIQQRDRLRDGTGVNCPNASCPAQSGAQTQKQTQKQTRTQRSK